jgi:hypothetical protein
MRTLLGLLKRWGWDSLVLGLLDVAKRVWPRNIRHGGGGDRESAATAL